MDTNKRMVTTKAALASVRLVMTSAGPNKNIANDNSYLVVNIAVCSMFQKVKQGCIQVLHQSQCQTETSCGGWNLFTKWIVFSFFHFGLYLIVMHIHFALN